MQEFVISDTKLAVIQELSVVSFQFQIAEPRFGGYGLPNPVIHTRPAEGRTHMFYGDAATWVTYS